MGTRRNVRWKEMDKSNLPLEKLIGYFETHNRSEGKSPRTVEWYNEALGLFVKWLTDNDYPTTLGSMDADLAREFILWMQQKPTYKGTLSATTVNNRVRALRAFFNWLYHMEYTEVHLLKKIRPPRLPQVVIEPLTDDEITRLFKCLDTSTAIGSRNRAILALFADTGNRLSEAVHLNLEDVHIEEQYVKLTGKGNKQRIVPFGTATKRALLHYLLHFRPEEAHPGVTEFFLTLEGRPLTVEGMKAMMDRLAKVSGIKRLHPHLLRHTYATNFLLNGGDALLLRHNLGHTTLTMVDHYVHLASRRAAIASRNYSPLDRMNIRGFRYSATSQSERHTNGKAYTCQKAKRKAKKGRL